MRIQIASDLHNERIPARLGAGASLRPAEGAQVLVLAGDVHSGHEALRDFADWPVPVVYVAGNHESYGKRRRVQNAVTGILAAEIGLHFLECSAVEIEGVRFLGCTLWTDYALYGNPYAAKIAAMQLYDHTFIEGENGRPFSPKDAQECHFESRRWLKHQLSLPFAGKTVVVTHHAPHPACQNLRYESDMCNPAYISDMRPLMQDVDLWVHGHVHNNVDLREGRCRVVANPRGYPLNARGAKSVEELRFENESFRTDLVVQV